MFIKNFRKLLQQINKKKQKLRSFICILFFYLSQQERKFDDYCAKGWFKKF